MRTSVVHCLNVQSESDFWSAYGKSAQPDGCGNFGRNLDALWDGLNGGLGWSGECELQVHQYLEPTGVPQ